MLKRLIEKFGPKDNEDKEVLTLSAIAIASFVVAINFFNGCGTRKIKTDYSFQYKGNPAIVQHEDVILGRDRYFVLIDGVRQVGRFISDDGKNIYLPKRANSFQEAVLNPLELITWPLTPFTMKGYNVSDEKTSVK